MFYKMTHFLIMINEVSWRLKNWINSLTFKIKNNCLTLNWLLGTINQLFRSIQALNKKILILRIFLFLRYIYILIFIYFINFNFYMLINFSTAMLCHTWIIFPIQSCLLLFPFWAYLLHLIIKRLFLPCHYITYICWEQVL